MEKEVGKATPEQLADWKKQYGMDTIPTIRVKVSAEEISYVYLKHADRQTAANASTLVRQDKILQAGEIIIDGCFIGGDERVKLVPGEEPSRQRICAAGIAWQANIMGEFALTES